MSLNIALIGEAWGESEAYAKKPFVGSAGQELDRMLSDAGISRNDCYLTNVFNLHPPGNALEALCCAKGDGPARLDLGPLVPGKYLRAEFSSELERLYGELEQLRPNIAVLLGNTPSWALLGQQSISKNRGTCSLSPVLPWLKCLPTYHPAYVLRVYSDRAVTVLDLIKAKAQSEFPDLRRPHRNIWIEPGLADIQEFKRSYLDEAERISFDIETAGDQITCIGFASTVDRGLVIPFVDHRKTGGNYWPTLSAELTAWQWVRDILDLPARKVAQNGLYDIQFLWQTYGIPVRNFEHDTMLLHHSLLPESPKGLAFLGSVYTDETSWKSLRPRGEKTIKRED